MKWITTLLLVCFSSLAVLSCEKTTAAAVSQPQKENNRQPQGGAGDSDSPEDPGTPDTPNNNQTMVMNITAGGKTVTATLADNATARELASKLQDGSVTVLMSANGFEHYGPLGFSLTSRNERVSAVSGDIMLYSGSYICVFYGNNTWSYTPLGKVDSLSADELKSFFGSGDISVTFSLKQ